MFFYREKVLAVYISCSLLFCAVLATDGGSSLEQIFLSPLDGSYSVLGSQSVFKNYISSKKLYAFLPYWSLDNGDLNTDAVTDLSYFGLNVDSEARIINDDGSYKTWRESKKLHNVISKLIAKGKDISITLICHDDDVIDKVLSCSDCWENLAADTIRELKWAGIKDLNVDFEYSGYTTLENAQKYSQLVKLLNDKLDGIFGDSFVVVSTFADAVEKSSRDEVRITDPRSLAESADGIFIMAYDFFRPTSSTAGPVSPMDGSYSTTKLNLIKTVKSYLGAVPANKLIFGLPFYGYDWVVENKDPMASRLEGNDSIGYSKVITYGEVTDLLVKKRIQPLWDDVAKTPYVNYVDEDTGSLRQIYYDNEKSLKLKADLASKNGFLGVGVWALGYEGGYVDLWDSVKLPL